jgi:putative pyrimidine permease RutG
MTGAGTLIFLAVTAGKVPSFAGSSFSFIAVVVVATGYGGTGPTADIAVVLGGIGTAAFGAILLNAVPSRGKE